MAKVTVGVPNVTVPAPKAETASTRPVRTDAQGNVLPESKVWANLGFVAEDGTLHRLPKGLAIDTMAAFTGQNPSESARNRNAVLAWLKELGNQLQPGDSVEVPLTVVLYRTDDTPRAPKASNLALPDFGTLNVVPRKLDPDAE